MKKKRENPVFLTSSPLHSRNVHWYKPDELHPLPSPQGWASATCSTRHLLAASHFGKLPPLKEFTVTVSSNPVCPLCPFTQSFIS